MPTYEYKCPQCGGKLLPKGGFFGPFVACENHPKTCKYTRPLKGEKKETAEGAGKPAGEKPAAESSEKPKSPKQKKDH